MYIPLSNVQQCISERQWLGSTLSQIHPSLASIATQTTSVALCTLELCLDGPRQLESQNLH